jgi:hypothetical protein
LMMHTFVQLVHSYILCVWMSHSRQQSCSSRSEVCQRVLHLASTFHC